MISAAEIFMILNASRFDWVRVESRGLVSVLPKLVIPMILASQSASHNEIRIMQGNSSFRAVILSPLIL
jgi:hypothetical protein